MRGTAARCDGGGMTETGRRLYGMPLVDPRPYLFKTWAIATTAREAAMNTRTSTGQFVHANGIDIHYLEAGAGEPLVLLNNGMISTNPIWGDWPSSYTAHRATLAEHFRVIEPDLRGSGRTVHPGGPIPYDLLAEDLTALIDVLGLDRPLIGGYGDGGAVATIAGIRTPEAVRAIVNHGGYDLFNPDPQAPVLVMTRQMLGGRPDATQADPDAVAGSEVEFLRKMAELMQADHDAAQGSGHWKTVLSRTFDRVSRPAGYTFEDLAAITAPTLILVGDRDRFCTVEEGARAYRALRDGELAVLPNTAAGNTPVAVRTAIEFLERHVT
jgi:pimeloyl-ACP methyl ester carboxylesterase